MPALPSILQTRKNSQDHLQTLLYRLANAATDLATDPCRVVPPHAVGLAYLQECFNAVEREHRYLHRVIAEIARQEAGGSVEAE